MIFKQLINRESLLIWLLLLKHIKQAILSRLGEPIPRQLLSLTINRDYRVFEDFSSIKKTCEKHITNIHDISGKEVNIWFNNDFGMSFDIPIDIDKVSKEEKRSQSSYLIWHWSITSCLFKELDIKLFVYYQSQSELDV